MTSKDLYTKNPHLLGYFHLNYKHIGNYLLNMKHQKNYTKFNRYILGLSLIHSNIVKSNNLTEPQDIELINIAKETIHDRLKNKVHLEKELKQSTNKDLFIYLDIITPYMFRILQEPKFSQNKNCMRLFFIDLALNFLIRDELVRRLLHAQKIKLDDQKTFFSRPIDYLFFYIVAQIKKDMPKSKIALNKIKKDTDKVTKRLYHPDDIEGEPQSEAEGLFNLLASKQIIRSYRGMTSDQIIEEMFRWNEDVAYFPNRFKRDLLNLIESQKSKTTGLSILQQRGSEEKSDLVKTTSYEDFTDEIEGDLNSSIKDKEYLDVVIEVIEKHKETLPKQAKSQRKLCDFFIDKLNSGNWVKYIQETKTKNQKTSKIKLNCKALSKDTGINLRKVQIFYKALTNKSVS